MTGSGIFGKGAIGLVAAVLAVGGGSAAVMAATGSHSPGEAAQNMAELACKAALTAGHHGIGDCVSDRVNHNTHGEAQQKAHGVNDADEHKSASPAASGGTHTDHGRGNGAGSVEAPGQGGTGNENHGKSDAHPSPKP